MWEVWGPVRRALGLGDGENEAAGQQQQGGAVNANGGQHGGNGNGNDAGQVRIDDPAAAGAQVPPNPNPPVNGNGNPPAIANGDSIIDTLASIDIPQGEVALASFGPSPDTNPNAQTNDVQAQLVPEPSLLNKSVSFLALFLATAHPAVWNKRRRYLSEREGRVREEMRMLLAGNEDSSANERGEGEGEGEGAQGGPVVGEELNARRAQAQAVARERYIRRPEWVKRYMMRVVSAGLGEMDAFEFVE